MAELTPGDLKSTRSMIESTLGNQTSTRPMTENQTTVVCVKVKDIKPKYQNLKEWMGDPQNVYIGRRGIVFIDGQRFPKEHSTWANPFKVGKDGSREKVIIKYKNYIQTLIKSQKITKQQLVDLRGKTLGCWCKTSTHVNSCHGDILIELINKITNNNI